MDSASGISAICSSLAAEGYSVRFSGFTALDIYLGLPPLPFLWAETNAGLAVLARHAENLRFPGAGIADGAIDTSEAVLYFRCRDGDENDEKNSFPVLSFTCDSQTRRFYDSSGIYPLLRALRSKQPEYQQTGNSGGITEQLFNGIRFGSWTNENIIRLMLDAALLLARYAPEGETFRQGAAELADILKNSPRGIPPDAETERAFLCCILVSKRPDLGLEFLKRSGFIDEFWPEIASFDDVDHSKEFHPEGNVWNHTLETFRHRKPLGGGAFDLRLSVGLLLHDAGKPIAASSGSRRFDGHAEIGARAAERFLERLEFDSSLISDIFYLVKNHMLPAALKRLPLTKTAEIMSSPLFPTLMELYRCDESSSFKGLYDYYQNSAAYQSYLRNAKNPYRSADGKKLGKRGAGGLEIIRVEGLIPKNPLSRESPGAIKKY